MPPEVVLRVLVPRVQVLTGKMLFRKETTSVGYLESHEITGFEINTQQHIRKLYGPGRPRLTYRQIVSIQHWIVLTPDVVLVLRKRSLPALYQGVCFPFLCHGHSRTSPDFTCGTT